MEPEIHFEGAADDSLTQTENVDVLPVKEIISDAEDEQHDLSSVGDKDNLGSVLTNGVNEDVKGVSENDFNKRTSFVSDPRRSHRLRKPPDRYGVNVMQQEAVFDLFDNKVLCLIKLLDIFPDKEDSIFDCILKTIMD